MWIHKLFKLIFFLARSLSLFFLNKCISDSLRLNCHLCTRYSTFFIFSLLIIIHLFSLAALISFMESKLIINISKYLASSWFYLRNAKMTINSAKKYVKSSTPCFHLNLFARNLRISYHSLMEWEMFDQIGPFLWINCNL